jgi:hypothetical protein
MLTARRAANFPKKLNVLRAMRNASKSRADADDEQEETMKPTTNERLWPCAMLSCVTSREWRRAEPDGLNLQ